MAVDSPEARKARYLEELTRTGSRVKARKAVGVVGRTVSYWRERDEDFLAAEEEALEAARDEVVQASRTAALAGDSAQLTNWMKLAHVELRPANTVQVGVQVNGTERRLQAMSDAELIERGEQIIRDARLRGSGDVIDVEVLPTPSDASEAPAGAEIKPEDIL